MSGVIPGGDAIPFKLHNDLSLAEAMPINAEIVIYDPDELVLSGRSKRGKVFGSHSIFAIPTTSDFVNVPSYVKSVRLTEDGVEGDFKRKSESSGLAVDNGVVFSDGAGGFFIRQLSVVDLKWFNGDLQKAHDALPASGGIIRISPKDNGWEVVDPVSFTKEIIFVGGGWNCSRLYTSLLNPITTSARIGGRDFWFEVVGETVTTSTIIKQLSSSVGHNYGIFSNVKFEKGLTHFDTDSCNKLVIDKCDFSSYSGSGLHLKNLVNSDIGDSFVSLSTFSGNATGRGILIESTAGLIINANKFFNELNHIVISNGGNDVGNNIITSNSLEGHIGSAITINSNSSGVNVKTQIKSNQISSNISGSHIYIGNGCNNTDIISNIINNISAGTSVAVEVAGSALNTAIKHNDIYNVATGIKAPEEYCKLKISDNDFDNVATLFVGETSLNVNVSKKKIQHAAFLSNISDTVFVDKFKIAGSFQAKVIVDGIVQGVGVGKVIRNVSCIGASVVDIDTAVTQGAAFDVSITSSGGYFFFGAKRATGVGTSITVTITIELDGYFSEVVVL